MHVYIRSVKAKPLSSALEWKISRKV